MQPLALRSSLLAVVAAVSLAGASHAQGHSVVPPAKITIGDGFSSSGTFNVRLGAKRVGCCNRA